ncbi:MAG: hypothetical protein COW67_11975 [Flavobacteriales bacterium CG18_big_fil_WC_8_21_14_2_50_32_9]|nr:MAG: hypothetical protein COW67_11975 [Flavobacteriales bacterium CG18_big_fil_WC_8_21_14_2_50_32_9]
MKYYFTQILFLLVSLNFASSIKNQSNTQLDSLERLLATQNDTNKIYNLGELCYQYSFIDTEKAIKFGKQGVLLAEKLKDSVLMASAYNDLSIAYHFKGDYDVSLVLNKKAYSIRRNMGDSVGVAKSLSKMANAYYELGDMANSLISNLRAISIFEQNNLEAYTGQLFGSVGNIYERNGNFEKALKFQQKATEIAQRNNDLRSYITSRGNTANIFQKLKKYEQAEQIFLDLIPKIEEFGNFEYLASIYQGLGVNSRMRKQTQKGIEYYQKALEIYEKIGSRTGMSLIYVNLGYCYLDLKKFDKANEFLQKGLLLSKSSQSYYQLKHAYQGLARLENMRGNYDASDNYFDLYVENMDSIYNEESNKLISEMQVKYETAEKEKQLAEQEVIITKEQLRVRQRNYTLVGLALVIIFIIILGVYIYKQQKFKQQKLIEENQLKDEIAKITLQNELHEERIRISRDLHDNVGSQLTFIISSVDNMGYLFKTADEKLREKLHGIADFSRTTITQLRDTIWALNKDEISFEDLKSRLYNYIESAKLAKENITFNFEVDVNQKISFNAIEGVNIYRIVQEAINNSLKYSAATTINVLLKESKDKLILKIEDDGIGFNINEVKLGNGLDNMKNRATSIKARFNIDSTPEKGTTILLEMPIK